MGKAPAEKFCKTCSTTKPICEFYAKGGARAGVHHLCKLCMKAYYHRRWVDSSTGDRERSYARYRKWFHDIKKAIFLHYGAVCVCCGETRTEFLTVDHVNGGGTKHRKDLGGGTKFFQWLKDNNFPEGYRILCMNCNFSLGRFGYCPHQIERKQ